MNFQPPDPVCSKCGAETPPCDCDYEAEKIAEHQREKLRELCNLVKIARQQKNSDPDIYTAVQNFHDEIDASHVLALLDHIDALKGHVKSLLGELDRHYQSAYCCVPDNNDGIVAQVRAAIASAPEVKA